VLWVVAAAMMLGLRAAPLLVLWVSVVLGLAGLVGVLVAQMVVQAQAVLVNHRHSLMR
jgi:hypothetical protein